MNSPRAKVLLTNPIYGPEQSRLAQHAEVIVAPDVNPDTLRRLVVDVDALIVRHKLPDDIFDGQTRLKGVVRHGVGLDMIPMHEANAHRIPVANVPGSNTASVVEYCLNAMFHFQRNLANLRLSLPHKDWATKRALADSTRELSGQTLGIIGVGAIGGALARVANALGMTVLGLTRNPAMLPAGVQAKNKLTLFKESDFIVICCPLNEETRGMVDSEALAQMKTGAFLINVARGPVVDTAALLTALQKGRLAGAALDVHDIQPIPDGFYPNGMSQLLLTPHLAGMTKTSMERMSQGSVDEVLRLIEGKPFANLVNPEIYERVE